MACRVSIEPNIKLLGAERIISWDHGFNGGDVYDIGNSCANSTYSSLSLARSSGNSRVKEVCRALSFGLEWLEVTTYWNSTWPDQGV
jgi:hypothetical protein